MKSTKKSYREAYEKAFGEFAMGREDTRKEQTKCKCGWHSANCSERKNKMRVLSINHGSFATEEMRNKFIMKEKSLRKRLAQKDARKLKEREKA